jgi:DNA-binding NarL/FixJ family response regulator
MGTPDKTYLYCYDDHRNFTEDVRKRFSDTARYVVRSFQSSDEFIKHLDAEKEYKYCKVAIIGVNESAENVEFVDHLAASVKNIDNKTGLILIIPEEKKDAVKKAVKFNIDSYIPKNANTVLRVHNAVKKLISEYNLIKLRRRRNFSLSVLILVTIIASLLIITFYLRFHNLI